MEKTCNICVENLNRSSRTPIQCGACDFIACRECYEKFLLQQPQAKCMGCSKEMTRSELVQKFTKKFINVDLKNYREKYLFEQEKAMLPATQPIVEELLKREQIKVEILRIRNYITLCYRQISELESQYRNIDKQKERKTFIRKCPNTECRGFLSTQWKCNLCSRKTCKDCNECIIEEEHKCDPNNVETAKLLAQDSKPCPNCGEIIFKIDGCDQIFCTNCHTAFSWRTGQKETGVIHNPHYFEWVRMNNLDPTDTVRVQCGREIDRYFIRRLSMRYSLNRRFEQVARHLNHFREVILPHYRTHPFADNQDLRIKYLRKEITEESFQKTLQKREKARQKKQEYFRLFTMMNDCVTDILYRFVDETDGDAEIFFSEITNLIQYVNSCLEMIARNYNSCRYWFSNILLFNKYSN